MADHPPFVPRPALAPYPNHVAGLTLSLRTRSFAGQNRLNSP